jgi:predicted RNase H-like HicB family nuclease
MFPIFLVACHGHDGSRNRAGIREAIEFHLEGLREDGNPIPSPSCRVDYVEVAA